MYSTAWRKRHRCSIALRVDEADGRKFGELQPPFVRRGPFRAMIILSLNGLCPNLRNACCGFSSFTEVCSPISCCFHPTAISFFFSPFFPQEFLGCSAEEQRVYNAASVPECPIKQSRVTPKNHYILLMLQSGQYRLTVQ